MPTLTIPMSRIEGHARVTISYRGSDVISARFEATELRGFETFVQGAPAEQMPVIVPRICGVCSTAHHLAAVKALEGIYEVEPPPAAIRIRELMMLGQLVQNQATSLFMFTMPDLPGETGLPSLFHFEDTDESLAPMALQVRRAGTELITVAGGQFIHPVRAIVGGVSGGISSADAAAMYGTLERSLPLAQQLVDRYWEMFLALGERIGTLGDATPTHYLAAVYQGHAFYGGDLKVLTPAGDLQSAFPVCDYAQHLTEVPSETSYSRATLYQGHIMRANSLARLNMLGVMGTPIADSYARSFADTWGHPAHAILLYDVARAIELVYCIEKALEILREDLGRGEFRASYRQQDGQGCGMVEAPRGPLIHHYEVVQGLVRTAKFVIPTQHNILAIERALAIAAERYIGTNGINHELERAAGRIVRAFDPCIACATH